MSAPTMQDRHALAAWARTLDGHPYVWGVTDCASLVRQAWRRLYGDTCFQMVPVWASRRAALRVAAAVGGVGHCLREAGAVAVPMAWPVRAGDVLVSPQADEERGLPALAVGVGDGWVLGTSQATGVWRRRGRVTACTVCYRRERADG